MNRRRYRTWRWPLVTDPALTVVLILVAVGIAVSFIPGA